MTMEELLASQPQKLSTLYRGQQVQGEVVSVSPKEIILDLGTKSEGVIGTHDIPDEVKSVLKVGSILKAFVVMSENEHGQTVLSYQRQTFAHLEGVSLARARDRRAHLRGGKSRSGRFADWGKFTAAYNQKSKLQGQVTEVNKGGLIVESGGVRGFLPNSQVGFELLSKSGQGMDNLIGQDLTVTVIEVDADNNKLIFSQRGQISEEIKEKLKSFKPQQKVTGKIIAILPFGLVVNVDGAEGLVFISDVSWDKVEDLAKLYETGQEIEVLVTGLDEDLGRLNLSIKQLSADPFGKLTEDFPADEVVKGEILEVSATGITVALDGVQGFLPASKMDPETKYEVGKAMSFLVDSVDSGRRRINLAPFVTSTAGLIYK